MHTGRNEVEKQASIDGSSSSDQRQSKQKNSHAIRLWPGLLIVGVQWFSRFILPMFNEEMLAIAVIVGLAGFPAMLIWWLFFSRAPGADRLIALVLIAASLAFAMAFGSAGAALAGAIESSVDASALPDRVSRYRMAICSGGIGLDCFCHGGDAAGGADSGSG